jgi:ABC-2 type transport system ATP-binding protein
MISVKNLLKRYGGFTAVDNISFEIERGSIFGFVGPNGAGKTTTLRIIATLLSKTAGEVAIDGRSIFENPRETRKMIGYMPDFFGLYDDLRVSEYLQFYGEAAGCRAIDVRRTAPALLELVGLADKSGAFVNNLSRGMKQRLCLARALVHQPPVLLLDEPASGLDPRARVELRHILKELQRMGHTIVISSHILAELSQLCTHIGVISGGRMHLVGPMAEVLALFEGDTLLEMGVLERAEEARLWLLEQEGVKDAALTNRGTLEIVYSGDKSAQAQLLSAAASRFALYHFTATGNNLEEIFMKLTGEENHEHQPASG